MVLDVLPDHSLSTIRTWRHEGATLVAVSWHRRLGRVAEVAHRNLLARSTVCPFPAPVVYPFVEIDRRGRRQTERQKEQSGIVPPPVKVRDREVLNKLGKPSGGPVKELIPTETAGPQRESPALPYQIPHGLRVWPRARPLPFQHPCRSSPPCPLTHSLSHTPNPAIFHSWWPQLCRLLQQPR